MVFRNWDPGNCLDSRDDGSKGLDLHRKRRRYEGFEKEARWNLIRALMIRKGELRVEGDWVVTRDLLWISLWVLRSNESQSKVQQGIWIGYVPSLALLFRSQGGKKESGKRGYLPY